MGYPDDSRLWHDREQWRETTVFFGLLFRDHREELSAVTANARGLRASLHALSPFIQEHTATVCPECSKVCCINIHGYYDRHDLIYIYALGLKPPDPEEGIRDADPCRHLFGDGCRLERSIRPFRCNWYFCLALIRHMEEGPARDYRRFTHRLHGVVDLRRQMIEEFSCRVNTLGAQGNGLMSLYTNSVKS